MPSRPPSPPSSALTDHLGYWLRFVSNHVSHAFARKLAGEGVTVAEWVVLRQLLDEPALAPSELARRMGMTRGAITRLADRLIAKKMLMRADNPDDARAHTLALTPVGRALVPRLAALADANDEEFFGALGPLERGAMIRILRAIVAERGLAAVPVG